jgi:hypothetical protein
MKKYILLGAALLALSSLQAQVAGYTFRHASGTMTEVKDYPGAVVTTHTVSDNQVTPEKVMMPFVFQFGNLTMDSIRVHENGYLWFGNVTAWYMVNSWPVSSMHVSAVKGIISPLGIELAPVSGVTTIKTAVIGTAPSRLFIIEWLHSSRKAAKTDPAGADDISFQVKLYEAGHRIEVVFGNITLNPNISSDAELGIKGATYSDFNNRASAPGQGWNNTIAGTAQTQRIRLTSDSKPSAGDLMIWTPGSTTGIAAEQKSADVQLFPVPADQELLIRDDRQLFLTAVYTIYDMAGKALRHGRMNGTAIPLNGLPPGTYRLLLQSGANRSSQLFLKKG